MSNPGHRGRGAGGGRGGRGGSPATRGGAGGSGGIFREGVPAQVPSRLADTSLQQLVAKFKSLEVIPDRPLRPGYGTAGTPITLRANFFPIKVPQGPIYDYVVEISPKTDLNKIKMRLFDLLDGSPAFRNYLPYIAHDRSQRLVASKKLPQPLDIPIKFIEDGANGPKANATTYVLSIRFDRELDPRQLTRYMEGQPEYRDYDPLPIISALNLVLQQGPNRQGVRVGKTRYFFPASFEKHNLSTGVYALQGFYASVRPAYKELMVNVNVCMSAFIEPGNLADRLLAFSRNSRGAMPTIPKSMVKSITVRTHIGHKKKLHAVGSKSARNVTFDCPELGGTMSVEQYFFKKYNIRLRHGADLPVIDLGNAKRPIWMPAELCTIEDGNPYRGKLNDKETAQMIRYACNPPKVNADDIMNRGFPAMGLVPSSGPTPLNGFNITIDPNMAVVPGRELPPPGLTYKAGQARAQNGSWNIMNVKFHRPAAVASWWVLVVRDGQNMIQGPTDENLSGLVTGFGNKLRACGLAMPAGLPKLLPPAALPPPANDPERLHAIDVLRTSFKRGLQDTRGQKPSFVLVLLENRDNFIYPGIKRIGDVELGIQTIHMQLSKVIRQDPRKQDQYFSNVALKVNTKLGGINHLLDARSMQWLTKQPTMMVGIDVTHPGPGSREGTPSIAAVVASSDQFFVQFPASLRVQETKKEMLDELTDMMVERLLFFEQKNKILPARVIVYRDGVSEGQFDTVIKEELPQILNAFKKLNTGGRKTVYKPQLSIIICGKRHNARFYPTNSQYADRNGNTRPGTVVDKGITGVFDYDFYLQAHAGLQGTVKATHYTVVYDEIGLSADEIQVGTHDFSYLYARATKAVSLIPAAYYADLACERGRCYLNDFLVDDKTSTAGGSRSGRDRDEEKRRVFEAAQKAWGVGLHPDMRSNMFYI